MQPCPDTRNLMLIMGIREVFYLFHLIVAGDNPCLITPTDSFQRPSNSHVSPTHPCFSETLCMISSFYLITKLIWLIRPIFIPTNSFLSPSHLLQSQSTTSVTFISSFKWVRLWLKTTEALKGHVPKEIKSCARDNMSCARDNVSCAQDTKSCAWDESSGSVTVSFKWFWTSC